MLIAQEFGKSLSRLVIKGITAMNAISRFAFASDNEESTRASEATLGLGPNQLTWLRRNIESFKHAEDQWCLARQDTVRAARMAGLI
jgi:hypothetical protein